VGRCPVDAGKIRLFTQALAGSDPAHGSKTIWCSLAGLLSSRLLFRFDRENSMKKWSPPKSTIHYVGILLNTDETILNYPLEHGFRFDNPDQHLLAIIRESAERWRQFPEESGPEYWEIGTHWICRSYNVTGMKLYPNQHERIEKLKLEVTLRILRLLSLGNILLSDEYFITSHEDELYIGTSRRSTLPSYIADHKMNIDPASIREYQSFISSVLKRSKSKDLGISERKLKQMLDQPFQEASSDLAFQNFELSFEVENVGLAFLSVITALEALYGSGSHRVARNAAVLLGGTREESEELYEELRALHEKRSKYLHTGKSDDIQREDVRKCRVVVSRSIKRVHELGLPRHQLLERLNTLGFGDMDNSLVASRKRSE